jgi:hypothetical protein
MADRRMVVLVTAPDGTVIRLSKRVAEALLALAVHLAAREDRLNRAEAWGLDLNCGRRDLKINVRENVQPIEFRSGLGA